MSLICVEYVWIGGPVEEQKSTSTFKYTKPFSLRSKTKCVKPEQLRTPFPFWNFDGSSTGQAETDNSEIYLMPRTEFKDPFRGGDNKMILCDTYRMKNKELTPHDTNTRYNAVKIFDTKPDEKPWFGIEQEFFLIDKKTGLPVGYNKDVKQGQYYCSVGSCNAFARSLVDKMLQYAIYAGVKVSGANAEVAPGQWEIQVGTLTGIEAGDHLWMLRYIMERVTEDTDYYIELHPKPLYDIDKSINGSGAHTNFSTKSMRQPNGLKTILESIDKMSKVHDKHMAVYGEFNGLRLSGKCETSSIDKFSSGVADRTASIRIPTETSNNGFGYFEDRRPSSIMDPYLVTAKIFETCCLSKDIEKVKCV